MRNLSVNTMTMPNVQVDKERFMDITNNNAGKIIKDATIGIEHMKGYLNGWEEKPYMFNYEIQENALNKLFHAIPENSNPIDVWKKVSLVDSYYSTNLKEGIWDAVLNIVDLDNFNQRVSDGDWGVVEEISKVYSAKTSNVKESISFASKYCSRMQPDKFPIYDKYVRQMLALIQKYHPFLEKAEDIKSIDKNYIAFANVMSEFCTFFFGNEIDYKMADRYLWTWAKSIIQSEYRKKKIEYYEHSKRANEIKVLLDALYPSIDNN